MVRKLGYSTLVFVLFLGIFELTSRIVESKCTPGTEQNLQAGWQHKFFGSIFDWHEPDPDLLWRFRANLDNSLIKTNSQHLIGDEIPAQREPGSLRILILGDSSPVGLGLNSRNQTFAEILKYLLNVGLGGRTDVEVINAAVSGYTSEQIRRFMDLRGWDLKPDLVILYCGNNDASISGPMSDQQLMQSQRLTGVRSVLSHLALYRVTRAVLARSTHATPQHPGRLQVRVSPTRFAENLQAISEQCQAHTCPLFVLEPPVPRLWPAGLQFRAFAHVTGRSGSAILPDGLAHIIGRDIKYCLDQDMFARLYGRGDLFAREVYASAFRDTLTPGDAIAKYASLIERGDTDVTTINNLGVSYWEDGEYDRADSLLRLARSRYQETVGPDPGPDAIAAGSPILFNIGINLLSRGNDWDTQLADSDAPAAIYLDSALQADYFSLRIKRDYLDVIDSLSEKQHFIVVDLPELFAHNGQEKLFIDHCHPTAEGHYLIAQQLAHNILSLLESRGRSKELARRQNMD